MTDTVRIVTPVDGSVFAERPVAADDTLSSLVERSRRAQAEWRSETVERRAELVGSFVGAMLSMGEEIVPELAWQMGRPVSSGAGELRGFEERAGHMISIAPDALSPIVPEVSPGFDRFITREPLGVVLVVAPWNYPFLTAVNSVVPALMAGNSVMLKHASQTLLSGERFQIAADRSGLPPGLVTNVVLSHAQTSGLLASGAVDQVNFTGSVEAGRVIERAAAGTFTGVGLELGGKDPAYVRHDAELASAVDSIVDGALFNSGQSCCGIERVYVHRSLFADFADGAAALAATYELGNPLDPATTLGPMVHGRAADAVRQQTASAIADGARTLVDGRATASDQPGSPYLAPQILIGVDHTMDVMREESFGPVVGIMAVDSDDEAVALMNDSQYGLTASIWTGDEEAVRAIGPKVETGTIFMNRADYLDPGLAWSGVKNTGRGITLSELGYSTLTRPKSYHLRLRVD